jgi:hypothetical protein
LHVSLRGSKPCHSSSLYGVVQWSNDGFQGGIRIVFAASLFIGGTCGVWTFNLTPMTFFSLLIFSSQPSYFQSSPSIYFSFTFSPCSFDYYLFYLKWFIKLIFFSNLILFQFFYLSDLVLILLIVICFILNLFFNWIYFSISSLSV